ncbi:MAG: FAD-dependent oxidoreductase, partial [Thermoguttaceae bacterium]|nr:FAD-dependent oxidoreductase [Thermoguttaceae bacterium]
RRICLISGAVTGKFVDLDYIHDDNADKDGKSVLFEFANVEPGIYDVRVSYSAHANRATNIPITVQSSVMRIEATLNEKQAPPIDGLFISLGKLRVGDDRKASVEFFAKGTNGHVVVDAAQLVPEK